MDKKLREQLILRPYEVGYGKPPAQGQFAKGKSGNPNGRPKKKETGEKRTAKPVAIDVATRDLVLRFADRQVSARGGDGDVKVTAEEAVLHSLLSAAVKGNSNAQKCFLDRVERFRASLSAEIAADHEAWRGYAERYPKIVESMRRAGKAVPDDWIHPDDLIFPEGQHVMLRGGADGAEAKKNRDYVLGLRDAYMLQFVYDERCFGGPLKELPLFLSGLFAALANWALPKRLQLDDNAYFLRHMRNSALRTPELRRRLKEAWISLGHPEWVGITTSPLRADALARLRTL
jgi:hypothetical protein